MVLVYRIVFICIVSFFTLTAEATTNSFDLWGNLTLNATKDKWLFHSMFNPRLNDNWSRYDLHFLRSGIGYQVKPGLAVMLGHDWFLFNRRDDDIDYENRIWQQILLNKEIDDFTLINRFRLEERFLEDDFITTLRWLIQLRHPLMSSQNINWLIQNEFFVDLNKDFRYSENRFFIGLNKIFTENLDLDLGYQLRHINADIDFLSHALLFNLIFNLNF